MRMSTIMCVLLLAGCARLQPPDDVQTVLLVRHAEKCELQGNDPELSEDGAQRASDLARSLSLMDVDRVYSTPFLRTMQTAQPLVRARGLSVVDAPVGEGNVEAMRDLVLADTSRTILVVGHSNTIPHIVNWLAGTTFSDLDEYEYDQLYVVRLEGQGPGELTQLRFGAPSSRTPGC